MNRNILIVSASIGAGHMRAAEAVRDELRRVSPVASVTIVDFLDQGSSLGNFIKEVYLKTIGVVPDIYDFLYHWSQEPQTSTNAKNATAMIMKARMLNLVCEYQPDLLVFTHPFACCAAAFLRRTKKIDTPLAAILTDFAPHQMWIHNEIEIYFVASEEMKQSLCDQGIEEGRIFVTGIPTSTQFVKQKRSNSQKSSVLPRVLVMGGSLGLGAVEKTVTSLMIAKTGFEIVVVTGNNFKLKQRLSLLQTDPLHPLTVIGYADRVNELMASASLLLTKPGALTCSEALIMELPMLLLNPIPGQEEENAEYLTEKGAALRIAQVCSLAPLMDVLFARPEVLNGMKAQAHALSQPNAAKDIVAILLKNFTRQDPIFSAS
jgi:processive 1,2-diacylglycerol beta-glucosyltransferase